MKIIKVSPNKNFTLNIITDDGQEGIVDVSDYLKSDAFKPLINQNEFQKVHNGGYFVEWQCGADLSSDTIFAKWKKSNVEKLQPASGGN